MSRSASHIYNCVLNAEFISGLIVRPEWLRSMPFEPRKTWYVSFELPKPKTKAAARRSPRQSETFFTEDEAKAFACAKYNEGLIVSAGTLNPYLPRRTIPSAAIHLWFAECIRDTTDDKGC